MRPLQSVILIPSHRVRSPAFRRPTPLKPQLRTGRGEGIRRAISLNQPHARPSRDFRRRRRACRLISNPFCELAANVPRAGPRLLRSRVRLRIRTAAISSAARWATNSPTGRSMSLTSVKRRCFAICCGRISCRWMAVELIDALAADGYRLAVGSSAPLENVELSLNKLGRATNSPRSLPGGCNPRQARSASVPARRPAAGHIAQSSRHRGRRARHRSSHGAEMIGIALTGTATRANWRRPIWSSTAYVSCRPPRFAG